VYQLYKIQHRDSSLAYIGMTKNFAARLSRYKSRPHGFVGRALKKHGFDAFEFAVIASAFSKENAIALEIQLIAEHGTKYPAGYNLTDGGEGHSGESVPAEVRLKISQSKRGVPGKKHTAETRAKMSASRKRVLAENPDIVKTMTGRKTPYSPEERAARLAAMRNRIATPEQKAKHKAALKSLRWVTDGTSNTRIYFEKPLPEGWRYGRS
jgi:group I intron endonuclease